MATDAKATPARLAKRLVLGAAVAVLAVAAVAQAADPPTAIVDQPRTVKRGEVVRITWTGGASEVIVERRHGLFWRTDAGNLVLKDEGDGVQSALWQPAYYTPSGRYRFRVDGVASATFRVRPCVCVIPGQVRAKWRKGRFRLSLKAEYAPAPFRGLHVRPKRVTTGRPVVRVMRDGRRVGSVRLRYRPRVASKPHGRGKFRGSWRGPRGPRYSLVFELVSLTDGFNNR